MSYSEARNHFEKARINTADAVTIEMLDGLKHFSHAIEEDHRTLEQHIRTLDQHIRDIQEQRLSTERVVLNKLNRNP
jgi:hypothetical protein